MYIFIIKISLGFFKRLLHLKAKLLPYLGNVNFLLSEKFSDNSVLPVVQPVFHIASIHTIPCIPSTLLHVSSILPSLHTHTHDSQRL